MTLADHTPSVEPHAHDAARIALHRIALHSIATASHTTQGQRVCAPAP